MTFSPGPISYELGILIADLEESRRTAEAGGFTTLEYLIGVALIEARRQAELQRDERRNIPDSEKWKPV